MFLSRSVSEIHFVCYRDFKQPRKQNKHSNKNNDGDDDDNNNINLLIDLHFFPVSRCVEFIIPIVYCHRITGNSLLDLSHL